MWGSSEKTSGEWMSHSTREFSSTVQSSIGGVGNEDDGGWFPRVEELRRRAYNDTSTESTEIDQKGRNLTREEIISREVEVVIVFVVEEEVVIVIGQEWSRSAPKMTERERSDRRRMNNRELSVSSWVRGENKVEDVVVDAVWSKVCNKGAKMS